MQHFCSFFAASFLFSGAAMGFLLLMKHVGQIYEHIGRPILNSAESKTKISQEKEQELPNYRVLGKKSAF